MTGSPDITGPKIGVGETIWYQTNINRERSAVDALSERAELCFYRLRTHYVWRGGNLAYDPAGICTKMGYKTVRSFNPGFDELVEAGIVSIEDGMIRFPYADEIIAEVQAGRDRKAKAGALGGEGKTSAYAASKGSSKAAPPEHSRNSAGVPPEPETENEQNQWFDESKKTTTNQQSESKNPPPSSPILSQGKNGGGGSDVHQVIEEFFRVAGNIWGPDVVAREQIVTTRNDDYAAEWLRLAGGSVGLVIQLIAPALTKFSVGRGCPGTLGAIYKSMPAMISKALSSAQSQSASKPFAGPSSSAGDDTWVAIKSLAFRNGHLDVAAEIRRRADALGDEEANRFAEDMRSLVSTKKERAAA